MTAQTDFRTAAAIRGQPARLGDHLGQARPALQPQKRPRRIAQPQLALIGQGLHTKRRDRLGERGQLNLLVRRPALAKAPDLAPLIAHRQRAVRGANLVHPQGKSRLDRGGLLRNLIRCGALRCGALRCDCRAQKTQQHRPQNPHRQPLTCRSAQTVPDAARRSRPAWPPHPPGSAPGSRRCGGRSAPPPRSSGRAAPP